MEGGGGEVGGEDVAQGGPADADHGLAVLGRVPVLEPALAAVGADRYRVADDGPLPPPPPSGAGGTARGWGHGPRPGPRGGCRGR